MTTILVGVDPAAPASEAIASARAHADRPIARLGVAYDGAHTVQVQLERALRSLPFAVDGTLVRLHRRPPGRSPRRLRSFHGATLRQTLTGRPQSPTTI